jgi:glycosyltransferase involved in cell wall biosynthesis
MLDCVLAFLRAGGYSATVASPIPHSVRPEWSVPFWRLPFDRTRSESLLEDGCEQVRFGVRLPELEVTYHRINDVWRSLIDRHDYLLAVNGSCLAAYPFLQARRSYLAWTATPYFEDKKDRVRAWPAWRRTWDALVVSPLGRRIESRILEAGGVMPLSEYTARCFAARGAKLLPTLPIAIDRRVFNEGKRSSNGKTIGFFGRAEDPRKNLPLLLESARLCKASIPDIRVWITHKEALAPHVRRWIARHGLERNVVWHSYVSRAQELAERYRQLDVFVVPSHQEGLCIAALEAMSCGCPVVSTRCGGPEEFIRDGANGYLVDFDPETMADRIMSLLGDPGRRSRFAEAATHTVQARYSLEVSQGIFWSNFSRALAGGSPFPREAAHG